MGERSWADFLRDELAPYPQRLGGTLRDTLSVALALILVMTLRVHAAAIGIYYIFLLTRQTPSLSLISALRSLVAVCAGVGSCLVLIQLTDNDPMARVLGLVVCLTITGFMFAASSLAAESITFCLFWFSTLAGFDAHHRAEQTVESSLWFIAATALSVACAVAVEYVFGSKAPVADLQEEMNKRLLAVERLFQLYAEGADDARIQPVRRAAILLSHAGQQRMQRVYERIVERNLRASGLPPGTRVRIPMIADLMDLVSAYSLSVRSSIDEALRPECEHIARLCAHIRQGASSDEIAVSTPHTDDLLGQIRQTLHELGSMPVSGPEPESAAFMAPLPSSKQPVFAADAFSNPQHVYFGLKMALAGTFCYLFYNAIGWPGIATSVVTALITALSTTAAMKQKQLFRLLGALFGGLLGILSVSFLFPYMDSITSLVLLVGAVTFASAWMARSPRIGYVGMQTALAFYLVAFEAFSAPVELAPARDRIVGVGVGLLVMWFVFDQIWPVRTATAMRLGFAGLLRETGQLFRLSARTQPSEIRLAEANRLRYSVGVTMSRLREMHEAVSYDFGVDREAHMKVSESLMQAAIAAAALFWSGLVSLPQQASETGELAEAKQRLARNLDLLARHFDPGQKPSPPSGTVAPQPDLSEAIGDAVLGPSLARYHELCTIVAATRTEHLSL